MSRQFSKAFDEYLAKEVKLGAIIGLIDNIEFAEYHCFPLLTCPKDGDKRQTFLALSHPHGASVNDKVDRKLLDNHPFLLKFQLIQEIIKDSDDNTYSESILGVPSTI